MIKPEDKDKDQDTEGEEDKEKAAEGEKKPEAEREKPKLKMHAITGTSRWKKEAAVRIAEKKKKKVTLKGYSKNAQHYKFLVDNIGEATAELPMALQSMLVDEALVILQGIYNAYERTLGRSHQMTRQAKMTVDNVKSMHEDFANA